MNILYSFSDGRLAILWPGWLAVAWLVAHTGYVYWSAISWPARHIKPSEFLGMVFSSLLWATAGWTITAALAHLLGVWILLVLCVLFVIWAIAYWLVSS